MKNNLKKEVSQYYLSILPSSNNDSLEQTVHKARLKINRYESVDSKTTFRNFFVVQFMFIREKSKNRIIRINTGILSNMKQKIKEFYH